MSDSRTPFGGEKGGVLSNQGDYIRDGPEGVLYLSVVGVVVIAPLTLAKAVIAAQKNPIAECSCVTIWGGRLRVLDDLEHHGIMYHFAPIRHMFVFSNTVCHE